MTMKMKNVVANGKTQRVTRLSKISPINVSQPSTRASIAFCRPVGISLRFPAPARTMTRMTAATIQEQIIEFVTGSPKTVNTAGGAGETSSSDPASGGAESVEAAGTIVVGARPVSAWAEDWAGRFTANIAAKKARAKTIFRNWFTVNYFWRHEQRLKIFARQNAGDCRIVKFFTSLFWKFF